MHQPEDRAGAPVPPSTQPPREQPSCGGTMQTAGVTRTHQPAASNPDADSPSPAPVAHGEPAGPVSQTASTLATDIAPETVPPRAANSAVVPDTVPPTLSTLPPVPGTATERVSVPGYEVLGLLGKGGMGVVYRARQVRLQRVVALKMILHADHATAAERERFRIEAESVARLQHPNVVQIHEVGEHDGLAFFSLEFCEGGSLADRLNGKPWQPRQAADLVAVLARAAHAAHQKQIVHRDLKPANVLLTADGTPKLTDFGLAKRLDRGGHTQSGALLGTPSYMAPEQAQGKTMEVGPAADVYSLGAILYELLTGRPPFTGVTVVDTVRQVLTEEPVPVRRLQRAVPRDLETICHRCLRKQAQRRYPSALDLADDLQRFLAGEPIRARPVGVVERAVRWARRHPSWALLAGLATAAILAALVGGLWFADHERRQTEAERQLRARAEDRARETRLTLYRAHIQLARDAWERGDVAAVLELLDGLRPDEGEEDLRGPEWSYLWRRCRGERLTLHGHTAGVFAAACSPDGRTLATGGLDRTVRLWDLTRGVEQAVLRGHTAAVRFVTFAPDGATLASGGTDRTVRLWEPATGRLLRELRGHQAQVFKGAFSPDGRRLATAAQDGVIHLWDVARGERLTTLSGGGLPVTSLAFSPDGATLATAGWDCAITLWETCRGRQRRRWQGHKDVIWDVAFSPDGRTLFSTGADHRVCLWDAATGRPGAVLVGHTDEVDGLAVAPDGRTVASASADMTVRLWDLSTGYERATLKGHTSHVEAVAFTPDGRTLISAGLDGAIKVWDARAGLARVTLPPPPTAIQSLAVAPDGQVVAAGCRSGVVSLWDGRSGRPIAELGGHEAGVWALAFGPTGEVLASGDGQGVLRLWRRQGSWWRQAVRFPEGTIITALAFAPDGRSLAVGSTVFGRVMLWDLDQRHAPLLLGQHTGRIASLAFAPDGGTLVSGSRDRTIKVWDVAARRERATLRGHTADVAWVGFSPDGAVLATAGRDATVRLWDTATLAPGAVLRGALSPIQAAAFALDGRTLVTGGGTYGRPGELKLWDLGSACERDDLQGHAAGIRCLTLSADGSTLATTDANNVLKVWEWRSLLPDAQGE